MEEAELIQRSQKDDREAFNRLVEAYQGQVYSLALRFLSQREAAEDATQETFLSAFKAIKGFRGGHFRAWLLRIAANACLDYHRRSRHQPLSLDDILLNPEAPTPADASESPEDAALRRELGQAIAAGLQTLPAEQRLAVILSDIQGLTYEEIAHVARSSLGTVKSRLHRGRLALRDYLLTRPELLPRKFRLNK